MTTIIRPTKEHSEVLDKLKKAFETIQHTCNSDTIKQCNSEIDEAFKTLNTLYNERRLVEVVNVIDD